MYCTIMINDSPPMWTIVTDLSYSMTWWCPHVDQCHRPEQLWCGMISTSNAVFVNSLKVNGSSPLGEDLMCSHLSIAKPLSGELRTGLSSIPCEFESPSFTHRGDICHCALLGQFEYLVCWSSKWWRHRTGRVFNENVWAKFCFYCFGPLKLNWIRSGFLQHVMMILHVRNCQKDRCGSTGLWPKLKNQCFFVN